MPNSIVSPRRSGDSNLKVSKTQGRRRTKDDPFLNMGFKPGKKWLDKNGGKCNMGFRAKNSKNTRRMKKTIGEKMDSKKWKG